MKNLKIGARLSIVFGILTIFFIIFGIYSV